MIAVREGVKLLMGLNVNYNIKVTHIDHKRVFITVFSDLRNDNSGNTHFIQPYIITSSGRTNIIQ